MNKNDLQRVLSALGIRVLNENAGGHFLNCGCPYAPFSGHKHNVDTQGHFGAKWNDDGKSGFSCFACKRTGTISKLVRDMSSLRDHDYSELLSEVMKIENGLVANLTFEPFDRPLEDETPLIEPLDETMYDGIFPDAWDVPVARAYLERRGISENTTRSLGLLYRDTYPVERSDGTIGTWFRGDILFPVRDRDKNLYGWSGRTTLPEDRVRPKVYDRDLPKRHLILGEDRWEHGRPTVIVEGLFGYAWLIEIGVEEFANVGCIMGSLMTREKADILADWGNAVVALLDNDQAGDIGLFGVEETDGTRNERHAMVPMLLSSVAVIVPAWPPLEEPYADKDGVLHEFKEDPDQLSYDEVRSMVFDTPPVPSPKPLKRSYPVDKHFDRQYK